MSTNLSMAPESEKEKNTNPFLEKTIENWLTTTNELGYQMPFCQLLLSEGYSVCHNSKQNAFEQGKDIIAIDKDGVPCGFQLKGGNITSARWRAEVKPEIEELIDYKIIHPSVDKTKRHKSFLVTNGELEDTVRIGIDNLNSGKWKDSPLQVITRGQLLNKFVELSGNFIPQEVTDYKSFLDLYFLDGRELFDEKRYSGFIFSVLRLNQDGLSKEERKRNIASAVLYTGYIISGAKKAENHISVVQILTLLCSHVFASVEKFNLDERYWLASFEAIWGELSITCQNLQEEISNEGLKKLVTSMWDGELGKYRRRLAVSYLFAYKIAQLIDGNKNWSDIGTVEFLGKIQGSPTIWGEGALFPIILSFLFSIKISQPADQGKLFNPIYSILEVIIKFNGRKSQNGMLSPYYGITVALKKKLNLLEEPIDEKFVGRSFMLKVVVDLLARHGKRLELEKYWRELTYISEEEFIPEQPWKHFLWRCENGETRSEILNQTQSWALLKKTALKINLDEIPQVLQKQPRLLPFFLLVYPHRITSNYVKFLDDIVAKA